MLKSVAVILAVVACALARHSGGQVGLRHFPRTIEDGAPRVVGGYDSAPGEFPHQVSIQLENNASTVHLHNCGGSILNEWWILTAAHCVVGVEDYEKYLLVVAGEYDLHNVSGSEQNVEIERIIVHSLYPPLPVVAPYDIALLKLAWPLELNELVAAIRLPEPDAIPEGDSLLSGWGSTGGILPGHKPSILQAAELPIVEYSECALLYEGSPLEPTNVCTGPLAGGMSACSGDSGGPLIQRVDGEPDVIIGVVSWGTIPCATPNAPSVYTRVSAYIDWINENMV